MAEVRESYVGVMVGTFQQRRKRSEHDFNPVIWQVFREELSRELE